jgi:membrane fusion protein (multidrug efflux system)
MKMNKAFPWILASLLFPMAGCKSRDADALKTLEADSFMVRVEKAVQRDLEEQIVLVGSVKAQDEAILFPRVPGKLGRNVVREGDVVKKNDPVAYIERDEVGATYEPAPVPATLAGVVGKVYLDVGADVTPQTPIALVVDQSRVRVKVDLPERYISQVFRGQDAYIKVDAFPNRLFRGKVYRISPVVDTRSRSTAIEILVDNQKGELKSGMFAEIRLVVGSSPNALSVPAGAVLEDDKERPYVFVRQGDRAVRRDVRLGVRNDDFVQVTGGLRDGEPVLTSGLYGIKDGSKIKVTP